MTIYDVTLTVKKEIESDFRIWLDHHIADVLVEKGFTSARTFYVETESTDSVVICTQYELTDRASLTVYLRDLAPRLRADGVKRFGDRFTAQRRVMELKREY